MNKPKAVMNWSGGKDSALALHKILKAGEFDVDCLFTSVNSQWQRVSMHGVRRELLAMQAEAVGIELVEMLLPEMPSMDVYEVELNRSLDFFIERGVTHSIFGDIFLADLRQYRETQLAKKGLRGVFPLWEIPTGDIMREFFELGFKAITVCVDAVKLDESFCGRIIDESFVGDLPDGVDICGENGEFHSFVFDGPIFNTPVPFEIGETVFRSYSTQQSEINSEFHYCDLVQRIKAKG